MFIIVSGLQKEEEKYTTLGKTVHFRAFSSKHLKKTNLIFCGMNFCSFFWFLLNILLWKLSNIQKS